MKYLVASLLLVLGSSHAQAESSVAAARTEDELPALLDWKALASLNDQASSVWGEMLDCAKGRTDLARAQYLNRNWDCPRAAAQKLHVRIRDFHVSVKQFLQSSFVVESDHRATIPALMLKFKQSESIHPLLVQSLYESLSLTVKFIFMDKEVGPKKIWKIDAATEAFIHKHWLILRFAEPGPCVNWGFAPVLAQSLDAGWFSSESRYIVSREAYKYGDGSWMHSSWTFVSYKLRGACGSLKEQNIYAYLKWWPQVTTLREIAQAHRK